MKFSKILVGLLIAATSTIYAQDKEISLEEIYDGSFRQEYLQSLQSLDNGKEYVVLNRDRNANTSSIDVYSYKSGEKVRSLLNSKDLSEISGFQGFELSENEDKILLSTNMEQIYRRSSRGIYYIYDVEGKTLTKLSDNKVQEPTFSPDASKVAYVFENNIYTYDIASGEETQVTTDGEKNKLINGVTDWVYEEEFAFVRAFDWNKTGTHLAYLKFDETEVPEFSMDIFGQDLYPSQQVFKYPKAGETNSEVSLYTYELAAKESEKVELGDYEDFYIPRIKWTQDPEILSVQVLNRHQNNLDLIFVDAEDNEAEVVMNETDEAYIDITNNLTFLEDNSFIWTSEKAGWNHIYLYDEDGELEKQVTEGKWEVTEYYG